MKDYSEKGQLVRYKVSEWEDIDCVYQELVFEYEGEIQYYCDEMKKYYIIPSKLISSPRKNKKGYKHIAHCTSKQYLEFIN